MKSARKLIGLATILLSVFLLAAPIYAASLSLTAIGNVDTSGKNGVKTWYYTSSFPKLAGTGAANADVLIKVGNISGTAKADASGNWSWQTTQDFTQGENQVTITSGTETLSFTLVIGQAGPNETASSGTKGGELPKAGVVEWTILGSVLGLLFIGLGIYKLRTTG